MEDQCTQLREKLSLLQGLFRSALRQAMFERSASVPQKIRQRPLTKNTGRITRNKLLD